MKLIKSNFLNKIHRVILLRHGQSIWNHDSKFTGWTNIPLTTKGKKEALIMAQALVEQKIHPTVSFSSVLTRSIETCDIMKKKLKIKGHTFTSWRLNEKHYGTLEGIARESIRNEYGDKFTTMLRNNFYMKPPVLPYLQEEKMEYPIFKNCYYQTIKNGESKENVLERLLPYFQNDILYQITEQETPMIVTHKHCIRVLMKHYLNISDDEFERFQLPSETFVVLYFNDHCDFQGYKYISYGS